MSRCILFIAAVMLCITACESSDLTDLNENQEQTGNDNKPSGGEGEGETESVKFMIITVERVSATKVVFKGTTKKTAPDIEVGIYWSKVQGSHINDYEKVSTYKITNGSFELVLDDLDADTKYYCYPYLFMNGARELGDEFEFKTAQPRFTIDKVSVDGPTVTFTGYADYGCAVGIYCSTTSPSRYNYETHHRVDSDDNNYSLTLNLSPNTTYYYCSYVDEYSNDNPEYGTIKSFVTHDDYTVGFKDLSLYSATDLSANGTANCYIVSRAGTYKMKTVKGNDANQALSSISKATILWETFGTDVEPARLDLIKGICYKSGYLIFETASTFREGNAVVAVKDASGKILWSWHIWFTDQPQGQVYYNGAGTMMDRNLGATSVTPGDVGALGLLYQWGRKDPFLGSSSISSSTLAKSTITWPSAVETSSSVGTVDYVTSNPTTFVTGDLSSNNNWHYSRDNTLWTTSDKEKSIYDPCPAGWRVPDGGSSGVWSKALGSSKYFEDDSLYNSSNEGINFSGKFGSASTIWYPASGNRKYGYGGLNVVGNGGYYWSASPDSNNAYRLNFVYNGFVYPSDDNYRASGSSVRCLQESK